MYEFVKKKYHDNSCILKAGWGGGEDNASCFTVRRFLPAPPSLVFSALVPRGASAQRHKLLTCRYKREAARPKSAAVQDAGSEALRPDSVNQSTSRTDVDSRTQRRRRPKCALQTASRLGSQFCVLQSSRRRRGRLLPQLRGAPAGSAAHSPPPEVVFDGIEGPR